MSYEDLILQAFNAVHVSWALLMGVLEMIFGTIVGM